MFLLLVISIFFVSTKSNAVDKKYTALQFGTTTNDYIRFSYNMAPFRNSLTLCSWIKRVYTSSSHPVVFHYYTSSNAYEILTTSNGEFNRVLGDYVLEDSHSKFTTPVGQWFHYCLSWSSSSRTIQLYLDGELAAAGQTSSGNWRTLHTSGTIRFNRMDHGTRSSHIFGGQLFQFNIYSEVLTSESIKKIADGGLCFDLKEFSGTRILRWEDILAKSRTGSVTEVTGCDLGKELEMMREKLDTVTAQLNRTKDDLVTVTDLLNRTHDERDAVTVRLNRTENNLESVTSQLSSTQDDLQKVTGKLNMTQHTLATVTDHLNGTENKLETVTDQLNRTQDNLETVTGQLSSTQDDLETATGRLNRTDGRLETCSSALTNTKSQLDGARKFQNITQWDILYTSPYYNNVLTEELFEQLKSSWDLLGEFVGVNVTDAIVEHFRKHDVDKAECGLQSASSIFDMLGELIGGKVMVTWGILQHFKENHNDVPCDD